MRTEEEVVKMEIELCDEVIKMSREYLDLLRNGKFDQLEQDLEENLKKLDKWRIDLVIERDLIRLVTVR